jgi:hypothetical protein
MIRAKKGMTVDQVRELWAVRAKEKEDTIWAKYNAYRSSYPSFGRSGLSVYEGYKARVTKARVVTAVSLLNGAGLEVSCTMIRKVTGQSPNTILGYWTPPSEKTVTAPAPPISMVDEEPPPPTYQFPRLR